MFANYKKRYIVFAFKFSANKEKGRDKLHYYFFKVTKLENLNNIEWVKCFYDGRPRYKLVSNDVKAELKVIQYEKLSDKAGSIMNWMTAIYLTGFGVFMVLGIGLLVEVLFDVFPP